MPSFHVLGELVVALWVIGEPSVDSASLTGPMGRTENQVSDLLETAQELQLVEITEDGASLTPAGAAFAASVMSELNDTFRVSTERFRDYRGYIPRRWYTNRAG
jgi:hypothetical protein